MQGYGVQKRHLEGDARTWRGIKRIRLIDMIPITPTARVPTAVPSFQHPEAPAKLQTVRVVREALKISDDETHPLLVLCSSLRNEGESGQPFICDCPSGHTWQEQALRLRPIQRHLKHGLSLASQKHCKHHSAPGRRRLEAPQAPASRRFETHKSSPFVQYAS